MELLVYVRNHGGRLNGSTFVGASIGDAPTAEIVDPMLERTKPLTSMAEFRIDAKVADPLAELAAAVHELFGRIGADVYGRAIYLTRPSSAIRVVLEPGFDTELDLGCELGQMLAMCSPKVAQPVGGVSVELSAQ